MLYIKHFAVMVLIFTLISSSIIDTNTIKKAIEKAKNAVQPASNTKSNSNPEVSSGNTIKTQSYGGNDGDVFEWENSQSNYEVRKIKVRAGSLIDQLTLILGNGTNEISSPTYGGNGGVLYEWSVPDGEYINKITIRSGSKINALKFHTNKGTVSPQYGKNGGTESTIEFQAGYRLIGFFGRSNNLVRKLGFILGHENNFAFIIRESDEDRFLPAYIGSGYDIIKGNPDSEDSFDPGFRSKVFRTEVFTQGRTTQDGKYKVPDNIDPR